MAYAVVDKRGVEPPKETCRVCGSSVVHSREYNKPTMECINHLRSRIQELEKGPKIDEQHVLCGMCNGKGVMRKPIYDGNEFGGIPDEPVNEYGCSQPENCVVDYPTKNKSNRCALCTLRTKQ